MPRLAVRTPNWLGDAVMALPALASLRRGSPDMILWVHPRTDGFFGAFLPGLRTVTDPLPTGEGIGSVLLLTDSFRSALAAVRSGIPRRIGRRGQFRGPLLTDSLEPVPGRSRHHSLDYAELASAAGAEGPFDLPAPVIEPSGPPHVALLAGARYGGAKRWPGFRDLASLLRDRLGLPVVLYGTPAERADLLGIADGLPFARVETGLRPSGLASALAAARVAVGNDSGGVHLAAALRVPTVTVFGSTSRAWTAPLGPATVTATAAEPPGCSPCFRRTCRMATVPPCLASVSAGEVAELCSDLLLRAGGTRT